MIIFIFSSGGVFGKFIIVVGYSVIVWGIRVIISVVFWNIIWCVIFIKIWVVIIECILEGIDFWIVGLGIGVRSRLKD